MPGKSVAKSDHAIDGTWGRPSGEVRAVLRNGTRVAAAVALLAFGVSDLRASQDGMVSSGPVIQRVVRAVPRKYVLSPSGPTVPVNQVQHFGVVDSDGKPVAVRWNISGLGCYGSGCGSIDERGVYHPPSSVPKPRMVTLEGVVIADPHYSVLTEIRLAEAVTTNEIAKAAEKPQLPAPQIPNEQVIASRRESLPLPGAVAATPGLEKVDAVRTADLIPLPSVIGAAPSVASQSAGRHSELPPVPAAIGATPTVGGVNGTRNADFAPLPKVVVAAPTVASQGASRHSELAAVPSAVAPTPAVKGVKKDDRFAELVLSPTVVITAPKAPSPVAASPGAAHPAEMRQAPALAGTALGVKAQEPVRMASLLPLPSTSAAPGSPSLSVNTQPSLVPGKPTVAASPALRTTPDTIGTSTEAAIPQDAVRVVYRDGQLTIDARNATLADVLKLVAEKTGATIDVPPGTALEPIVEHAGPGLPNDVLTRLLNGSRFNFIIVNSTKDPQQLAQVLLSVRPADTGAATLAAVPSPPIPSSLYQPDTTVAAQPLPARYDPSLQPPSGQLTPEAIGELMKEKAKELRERNQEQYPPQQPQ
jgi:hypothetical protein